MISLLNSPFLLLITAISILVAITVHEFSHAIAADKLGDPTARLQGRVSLNPLVHLDLIGTAMLFLIGFGWGKPVQFDPYNLKDPRRDSAIISFAGPLSNFVMAIILSIIIKIMFVTNPAMGANLITILIIQLIRINVVLGVFNLLPIHPLDGFKIVGGILSEGKAREWYELERYGMIFLIFLLIPFGQRSMLEIIMSPVLGFVFQFLLPGM